MVLRLLGDVNGDDDDEKVMVVCHFRRKHNIHFVPVACPSKLASFEVPIERTTSTLA